MRDEPGLMARWWVMNNVDVGGAGAGAGGDGGGGSAGMVIWIRFEADGDRS